MVVSRAAAKRTTGAMPDGHGLAGGAGVSRLDSGAGVAGVRIVASPFVGLGNMWLGAG